MAITTVYYRPHIWSPAYNPIVWSFTSNNITETDFSFVIDLYINGATTYSYRLKQRPNPSGACMIDVSSILQTYIDLSNYSAEEGWDLSYRNADEILARVSLRVGEEFLIGGVLVITDGYGVVGEPAYPLYAQEENLPVRVIPAALTYRDGVEHMAATGANGLFAPYIMDGDGLFLKRAGNDITVWYENRYTLAFLNWDDNAPAYAAGVQLAEITEYSATGANLGSFTIQNTTGNGGGPQTTAAYTTLTETRESDMLTFRCGPKDLENVLAGNTASYTVQLYKKASATSSTAPGNVASEIVTFTLNTECNNLYPDVQLSWLNDLGGRDYYNFTKFFEKSSNSPGDVYNQTPYQWNGTTPVTVDGVGSNYQNWQRGGNKSFNKVVTNNFAIQTDYLLQDEVDYLGAISESPSVWAYIGDDPTPYTVTVNTISYNYKLVKQVKLVQAIYDLTYTKTQQKQNL